MALLKSDWLHGLHEGNEGGLHLYGDKPSWIVFTEAVGMDPNDKSGKNFSEWTSKGFWPIVRINNAYEPGGTIPHKDFFGKFALRVYNYVKASIGPVYYWVIGNEPNLIVERPHGWAISPEDYVACYLMCRKAIKSITGHEGDVVMITGIGPWNNQTGHWMDYFKTVLQLVEGQCDGICLHAYTHGHSSDLIFSEEKMRPPDQEYHYQFRVYQDFMRAIPKSMRSLPVIIKECTQVKTEDLNDFNGWLNTSTQWIQNSYKEIDGWNNIPENQTIQGLVQYRFPEKDDWGMATKGFVLDDFKMAVNKGYESPQPRLAFKPSNPTTTPEDKELFKGSVAAPLLNVRNAPGTQATQLVGTRSVGDSISVYESRTVQDNLWYRIGKDQWVSASWIEVIGQKPIVEGTDKWKKSKTFTSKWEGEFQNFAWDLGNWTGKVVGEGENKGTKYGISAHSYPNLDIKNLTREQADEIYYRDYWLPSGADRLEWPFCLYVFDTAINFNPTTAKKWVAESKGDPTAFMALRLKGYRNSDAWPQAGNAWVDRVVDLVLSTRN